MNEHSYSVSQQTQIARLSSRMQRELKRLQTDPPPGICAWPSNDNLLTRLEAQIEGPEGTVYATGIFKLEIQVPERYPFEPPNVKFVTPIYHPNIDNGGRICLDILNLPPKGAWAPSLNIATVLASIGLLLSEPNPDDGLMGDISAEYKHNRSNFDQKARSCTQKYAMQMDHQLNTFPMETSCAGSALLTGQTSNKMIDPLKQINEIAAISPSGALDASNHKGEVENDHLVNPVKPTQLLSKKLSLAREPVLQPKKDPSCEIVTDGQRKMYKENVHLQLARHMDMNAQQKFNATSVLQTNDAEDRLLGKRGTGDSSSLMQHTSKGQDRSAEEIILLEKENLQARSWNAKKPSSKLSALKPLDGNSKMSMKENMKTVQLQSNISIQTNQSIPSLQNHNKRRHGELQSLQSTRSTTHDLPMLRSVQPEDVPKNSTEERFQVGDLKEVPTVIVSDSESDEEPVQVRSRLSLPQKTLIGKRKLRSNVG